MIFPPGSSDADIVAALSLLAATEGRVVTVDLEWCAGKGQKDMIYPWSKRGEAYSISFTGQTIAGKVSVALSLPLSPAVHRVVGDLLKNRRIVAHAATSDLLWMQAQGWEVNLAADTLTLGYLLDETQPLSLEAVALKYGTETEAGWKGHLFQERPVTDDQWEEILTYNAADTEATLDALKGMNRAIQTNYRRHDILTLHEHLLIPVTKVLARAAYAGVPIDEEQLRVETRACEVRKLEAAEALSELVHTTPKQAMMLANSSQQTLAHMHSLGLRVDNTEADTLKPYAAAYPSVAGILRVRAETKMLSTYLLPWSRLLHRQGDGRLHSIYKPTGARTGRSSAEGEEGGTLQTAPRQKWVRSLVKCRPGYVLVSGDYTTVEMRMAADIAGDQTMIAMFQEGEDFDIHTAVAAFIKRQAQGPISLTDFLTARSEFEALVTRDERQGAKGVNFGLTFGMMEEKLVDYSYNTYGVVMTLEEAKFARDSYMKLFSALPIWHERARSLARRTGLSQRTRFGRVRRFDNMLDVNAAINTPVQSSANDFAYLAMVQVDRYIRQEGLDALVIGYIHDSIMIESAEACAPRVKQLLEWVMPNVDTSAFGFKFPIPLPAEVKVGESWAA